MVMVLFGLVAILVCMQDMGGNEKSTGLAGRIHERIRDWGFRHPWIARPFWYSTLLVAVLGVCHWEFNYFDLYHTDADSARYVLSAMVQAQAAIIAIVITLTLIAVQLTASAYSPRVIHVFKKNPDMWILLVIYGVSMLYGLIVLKIVEEVVSQGIIWSRGFVSLSFEHIVSLAYWLEAFTLVALMLYLLNIIDLLKPENIIKKLAIEITKDNILNAEADAKDDPIQPIVDIIHGSVMKYDIATTRIGLKAVTNQVIEIIDPDSQEEISKSFCNHFNLIGKSTVRNTDEESTGEVIQNLGRFGKSTAENGLKDAALKVVESLWDVGEIVAEKGFDDATSKVAESLKDVGISAAEKGSKFENVATQVAVSLGTVGRITAKKELENAISQVVESLSSVGWSAAKNRLNDTMFSVALSLGYVGISAAERGSEFEHIVIHVAMRLQRVCAYEYNYEYKNENVLLRVASSLGDVGVSAAENRLNDATSEVVRALGFIGVSAAEEGKGFEHVVRCAVVSLVGVGTTAIEKEELKYAISEAAQSLAELTISSEEIVKNTIQELKQEEPDRGFFQKPMELYERQIRQDRDSFQKFMDLYEQRLEELRGLRTRKPN